MGWCGSGGRNDAKIHNTRNCFLGIEDGGMASTSPAGGGGCTSSPPGCASRGGRSGYPKISGPSNSGNCESAFIPFVSFGDLDNNTFKGLTSLLSVEQEIQYDEHT
jgi:hypothetical protein